MKKNFFIEITVLLLLLLCLVSCNGDASDVENTSGTICVASELSDAQENPDASESDPEMPDSESGISDSESKEQDNEQTSGTVSWTPFI